MDGDSQSANSMALNATENFLAKDYVACLSILNQMKTTDYDGNAVGANAALVEFAFSGWQMNKKYKGTLEKLKSQEQWKNDTQQAVVIYNSCVDDFHARRWSITISALKEAVDLENASPFIRMQASLLLAETYLKLCDAERAASVLNDAENLFDVSPEDDENSEEHFTVTDTQKYHHFLAKIRCSLMLRNTKRFKKEIKSVPASVPAQPYLLALFKSHQEYQRDNYRKSLRLIATVNELAAQQPRQQQPLSFADSGDCLPAILNNALGCNYARIKKYNLALMYFERALNEYKKAQSSFNVSDPATFPVYARHHAAYIGILHNYGLSLLYSGQAERAFECLLHVVKIYPKNARLWLRLAECCIFAQQKNNAMDFNFEERRFECVRSTIGVGPHRKIVLNTNLSNRKRGLASDQAAVPALTFEFAYLCLKNALQLLPQLDTKHLSSLAEASANSEKENSFYFAAPPQSPFSAREVYRLKCSILCAMGYVSLCVGEYLQALDAAKQLLALEYVSPLHKFLGRLFAAESLIMCNRLKEAAEHLSLEAVTSMTAAEFPSENEREPPVGWYPKNGTTATWALLYNVGVLCHLLGAPAKANEIMRSSVQDNGDCPVLAISQSLYQTLQNEQFDQARTILRLLFPHLHICYETSAP